MPLQIVENTGFIERMQSVAVPSVWQFGGYAVVLFLYSSIAVGDLVELGLDPRFAGPFFSAPTAATVISAARMPMIVITTRSSTRVKPRDEWMRDAMDAEQLSCLR